MSGSPQFKKKGRKDSFTLSGDGLRIASSRKIRVPTIGILRTFEDLPQVTPKSVTISRQADRWFISFRIEVESFTTPKAVDVVGVDLGVKSLATLSTGQVFEGAKSYRRMEAKLSRLQWLNRHKQKGSANWKKAQVKIARLHQRITNIRKDTIHKLTTYLAKNHSLVVIENLNVSGMLANRKLAKSIADMGFHEFRRQLDYKSKLYNSHLVVIDRWFPSSKTCSNCGCVKQSLTLSQRVFECNNCSFKINRDLNAAINLKNVGSHPMSACGLGGADSSR